MARGEDGVVSPRLTIVLPTYNRAAFLPGALASIVGQTFSDWELVVIDDGSTDDTREVLDRARPAITRDVRYIRQENGGPAVARNNGIAHALGDLVAFFDSDDLWHPAYLETCVAALDRNPDVDWVYAACRILDLDTGAEVSASTFRENGKPRPFLSLPASRRGEVMVLNDPRTLDLVLSAGLYAGFQNSVIRAATLRRWPLPIVPVRVGEDTLTAFRAVATGATLAYVDRALVDYRAHQGGVTDGARAGKPEALIAQAREYARGYDFLLAELAGNRRATRLLERAAAHRKFWIEGYLGLWALGRRREALTTYRKALALSPLEWTMWKTWAASVARTVIGR